MTTAAPPGSASPRDRYRVVGPAYERLTRLASGTAIDRCRQHAVCAIAPGDHVLFVGAGHGTDAVAAAKAGAHVTVVERSATMIACLRDRAGTDALRIVHGDAFEHDEAYDVVVANFFLNVFDDVDGPRMRDHLVARLRTGGRFVIGDFARHERGLLAVIGALHWYLALVVFKVLAGNAVHRQPDHRSALTSLRFVDEQRFRVLGLPLYASQTFVRDV